MPSVLYTIGIAMNLAGRQMRYQIEIININASLRWFDICCLLHQVVATFGTMTANLWFYVFEFLFHCIYLSLFIVWCLWFGSHARNDDIEKLCLTLSFRSFANKTDDNFKHLNWWCEAISCRIDLVVLSSFRWRHFGCATDEVDIDKRNTRNQIVLLSLCYRRCIHRRLLCATKFSVLLMNIGDMKVMLLIVSPFAMP